MNFLQRAYCHNAVERSRTAIRKIQDVAASENLNCTILDDRTLDELPELFLPGMLLEITVPE